MIINKPALNRNIAAMKKILSLLLIACVMSACDLQFTPLKGNYPADYSVTFDKPADEVITDVVEYCFRQNISLKTIDRKSGLVISEPYKIKTYTFENPDGTLQNSGAIAVIGREEFNPSKNDPDEPSSVYADIMFIIKEEDNKTTMTVRLANIAAYLFEGKYGCMREVKSTGLLEKQIIYKMK